MTNAKIELLDQLKNNPKVKCAEIYKGDDWDDDRTSYLLKCNHSKEDLDRFINSLDFNYDSGYGGQELFGTLWFVDGSWIERGEYDGSEWWEYKTTPEIPKELE
ncbi:hypothetical protein [Mesonia mobilis]|uniref:hypothetical protein n=1 Tax=Mesonia mobilis TaxID=369791 RepID=UPI0024B91B1E|nr:hypothetical protein [Mesonia mobilis]